MLHVDAQSVTVMFSFVAERTNVGILRADDERQPMYVHPCMRGVRRSVAFCELMGKGGKVAVGDNEPAVMEFRAVFSEEILLMRWVEDSDSKVAGDGMSVIMLLEESSPDDTELGRVVGLEPGPNVMAVDIEIVVAIEVPSIGLEVELEAASVDVAVGSSASVNTFT